MLAVLGTGASAIQLIPADPAHARELTVYQRTALVACEHRNRLTSPARTR